MAMAAMESPSGCQEPKSMTRKVPSWAKLQKDVKKEKKHV